MKGVLHAFNKRFSTTASKVATNSSTKIIKKPKFRGMFKFDDYHQIKFDKHWQNVSIFLHEYRELSKEKLKILKNGKRW